MSVDAAAHSAHLAPVPADTAAKFAKKRHLFVTIENSLDIIGRASYVARAQLMARRAGV